MESKNIKGNNIENIRELLGITRIKKDDKILLVDCPREVFLYLEQYEVNKIVGYYSNREEYGNSSDDYETISIANYYKHIDDKFDVLVMRLNANNINNLKPFMRALSEILYKSGRVNIFYEFNDEEIKGLTDYQIDTIIHDLIYGHFMATCRSRVDNGYLVSAIKLPR